MESAADTHYLAANEWALRIVRIKQDITYLELVHATLIEEKDLTDPTVFKSQEKRIFRALRRNKSDIRFAEKQQAKIMRKFHKAKVKEDHSWAKFPSQDDR